MTYATGDGARHETAAQALQHAEEIFESTGAVIAVETVVPLCDRHFFGHGARPGWLAEPGETCGQCPPVWKGDY